MNFTKKHEFSGCVSSVCLAALFVIALFLFVAVAFASTREEITAHPDGTFTMIIMPTFDDVIIREAAPAKNGGLLSWMPIGDGSTGVETYKDGTVKTNAVRTVQTPLPAVPKIESALMREMIIVAELEKYEGDTATRLQLAAEQATRTLTTSKDIEPAALGDGAAKEVSTPPMRGD